MYSSVNTIWVLLGAALVFLMQAGFAMCEAGFTRAKNTGNILMKNLMDFCIGTPCFWLVGFGIMFGAGTGLFGWFDPMIMKDYSSILPSGVPLWAYAIFQTVFCATSATIVSGAMAEFCAGGSQRYDKVALVYDVRTANSPTELFDVLDVLKHSSGACSLLFLEAEPETIIKRYKETRRRHPLMQQTDSLEKAVRTEQEMMEPLRQRADVVIDTTHLSTAQLRGELLRHFGSDTTEKGGMSVTITSFGFKSGLPMEADLVFDVRCMPNPFYIPELREKTGLDQPVADYVFSFRQTHDFMEKLRDLLTFSLPLYAEEGKTELVIAVGCTGGRHRSVAMTHALAEDIRNLGYRVRENHRDMNR